MPPIKVLVIDDAVVIRKIITDIVNADPETEVIGTASNGKIGLAKLEQLNPDIITLDVEMPVMNGLETLVEIRKTHPSIPVVMFSTLTERGAEATVEALARGATDYVTKPANVGSIQEGLETLRQELLPRLKALVPRTPRPELLSVPGATKLVAGNGPHHKTRSKDIRAVVLGASTGGPSALETVFTSIPKPLPVPVFIVQHIPVTFSRLLAERLDRVTCMSVKEATDGDIAEPGVVYLAEGGMHMTIVQEGTHVVVRTNHAPRVNSCRPAVDVLFESAHAIYGGNQLAVILTGMGHDGLAGCELLGEAGAPVIVQDEATSVVWGMPGYVADHDLADEVLPLDEVGQRICAIASSAFKPAFGALT